MFPKVVVERISPRLFITTLLLLLVVVAHATLAFTTGTASYSSQHALSRPSRVAAFVRPAATPTTPIVHHRYKTTSSSSASLSSSSSSSSALKMSAEQRYSDPDQPARFAQAQAEQNQRYLDITSVYDASFLKGKRVAVTGANRGIGLALAKELTEAGAQVVAIVRSSSAELDALNPAEVVTGIDVTNDEQCASGIASQIKGGPIDILVNNAGYFMEELETLQNLNFPEQIKTIDICACGPLRVSAALVNAGLLQSGSKIIMITSQGGSITWRTTQNPTGHDYGHHMSKAAANMMAVLLSQELKAKGIAVGIFHPGFNKTGMTAKYQAIWDVEGAVDASIGAKRIFYEAGRLTMATTGKFINCEDGLEIPW